jgi:hypothetical protein
MRQLSLLLVGLFAAWSAAEQPARPKMLTGPAAAEGKLIREVWFDRSTASGRLGWLQMLSYQARQPQDNVQRLIRTVQRDHLRYLRSGDPYQEDQEQYDFTDQEGKVIEVGYRTSLGKNQDLVVRGRPSGNRIVLEVLDHAGEKVVYRQEKAWDPDAKGMLFQDRLLEGKDLSPGKAYDVKAFMPMLNAVVPTTYTVQGRKTVTLGGTPKDVIHVIQTYPKSLFLDKTEHYLDPATGETLASLEDNSLFGIVTHARSTKDRVLLPFAGKVKDKETPVGIDKPLPLGLFGLPRHLRVKIEMTEDDDPGSVFVSDARQQFVKKDGKQAEFRLASRKLEDVEMKPAPKPGAEYLQSNFYIRSDDEVVKKVAAEAVSDESDPAKQMERITRWVKKKVQGGYEVGFATADEVARTLEGDCTEMGVLSAAMGRARGIPTRVCFGLVYDPENPGFGGHLWTEAFIGNAWRTYDATGVLPLLGAAYLKIDSFSFQDVLNPDELPTVRRAFAGKMKVTLLEAK